MDTFANIWNKIGGRKLIAFFLGLAALVLLAMFERLSSDAMWGIIGLSAAFAGGNASEHLSAALKARATAFFGKGKESGTEEKGTT